MTTISSLTSCSPQGFANGEREQQAATRLSGAARRGTASVEIVRAKLRRRAEPEHFGLNIYPMMDMLTILLVYMMAIFATSSAAAVQESSELRIPYSTSKVELSDALGRRRRQARAGAPQRHRRSEPQTRWQQRLLDHTALQNAQ
jgi:hypothetical protein